MTNASNSGTNAGEGVTVPPAPARSWVHALSALPRRVAQLLVFAVIVLLHAGTESASIVADMARNGVGVRQLEPWIWEFSSAFGLLLCFVPLLMFDEALRARVGSLAVRLLVLAPASVVFCAAHVAAMMSLRALVYAMAGWPYRLVPSLQAFVYEYRKDVLTFALILAIASAWRALLDRAPASAPEPASIPAIAGQPPPTFLVRTAQGDLLVRTEEIDWVEAQGNYVALHVQGATRLLRQTLAQMETRLKDHGFIRTHRSALVNRQRMQAIMTAELGELGVRLSNGEVAPLSESRRSEVVRLVLGA